MPLGKAVNVVHLQAMVRRRPAGFAVCSYQAKSCLSNEVDFVTCKRCMKTIEYKAEVGELD